jgi:hypothetical protein
VLVAPVLSPAIRPTLPAWLVVLVAVFPPPSTAAYPPAEDDPPAPVWFGPCRIAAPSIALLPLLPVAAEYVTLLLIPLLVMVLPEILSVDPVMGLPPNRIPLRVLAVPVPPLAVPMRGRYEATIEVQVGAAAPEIAVRTWFVQVVPVEVAPEAATASTSVDPLEAIFTACVVELSAICPSTVGAAPAAVGINSPVAAGADARLSTPDADAVIVDPENVNGVTQPNTPALSYCRELAVVVHGEPVTLMALNTPVVELNANACPAEVLGNAAIVGMTGINVLVLSV